MQRAGCGRTLEATVLVQCLPLVVETEDFLALAEREQLLAGIIGWVDLSSPDVAGELDGFRSLRGGDLLRTGDLRAWTSGIRGLAAAPLPREHRRGPPM